MTLCHCYSQGPCPIHLQIRYTMFFVRYLRPRSELYATLLPHAPGVNCTRSIVRHTFELQALCCRRWHQPACLLHLRIVVVIPSSLPYRYPGCFKPRNSTKSPLMPYINTYNNNKSTKGSFSGKPRPAVQPR